MTGGASYSQPRQGGSNRKGESENPRTENQEEKLKYVLGGLPRLRASQSHDCLLGSPRSDTFRAKGSGRVGMKTRTSRKNETAMFTWSKAAWGRQNYLELPADYVRLAPHPAAWACFVPPQLRLLSFRLITTIVQLLLSVVYCCSYVVYLIAGPVALWKPPKPRDPPRSPMHGRRGRFDFIFSPCSGDPCAKTVVPFSSCITCTTHNDCVKYLSFSSGHCRKFIAGSFYGQVNFYVYFAFR